MADPFEAIGIRCAEMALELRRMMLTIPNPGDRRYEEASIRMATDKLSSAGSILAGIDIRFEKFPK